MSSRPVWSRRSASKPASRRASSTAAAASVTAVSWLLNKSTSSVGRSMIPCAIRALPPARAKPCRAAVRRAIVATSRWRASIGISDVRRPASGGGDRGGPQGRVLLLPRLAHALGQEQAWPEREQHVLVEVGQVRRAAGLAEHGLVHPGQHARLIQVEGAVRVPEQPDRQLDSPVHRPPQVRQAGRDQRPAPGTGHVAAPGCGGSHGGHAHYSTRSGSGTPWLTSHFLKHSSYSGSRAAIRPLSCSNSSIELSRCPGRAGRGMLRGGQAVAAGMTTVGFIGSGMIGGTVARLSVASGYQVVLSNSRGPETLKDLVEELGPLASAATSEEAAAAEGLVVGRVPLHD